eukprot:scpid63536/ scgid16414/ 
MASNTPDKPTPAADPASDASQDTVKKDMKEAGVPDVPGAATITSIFAGDHNDVMILGYMTAIVKLFDGANDEDNPTVCTTTEEFVDWLAFAVVVAVYITRHFVLKPKGKMWHRVFRSILFALFALCIHNQPISCSLPRASLSMPENGTSTMSDTGAGLATLHYVQGATMLTLAIIATEFFRQKEVTSAMTKKSNTDVEQKQTKPLLHSASPTSTGKTDDAADAFQY